MNAYSKYFCHVNLLYQLRLFPPIGRLNYRSEQMEGCSNVVRSKGLDIEENEQFEGFPYIMYF